jgi:tetratricopeptide (TPR) repeat protein
LISFDRRRRGRRKEYLSVGMIRMAAANSLKVGRLGRLVSSLYVPKLSLIRSFSTDAESYLNPVALQMINYALSLARSQKSDESYGQGLLVLEQCQSTQSGDNSRGLVQLAMSTLSSERGNFDEAIEKLQRLPDLAIYVPAIRVAAAEALVGLHLELGLDDASSELADKCLQLLDAIKLENSSGYGSTSFESRAKATKGLAELVRGNLQPSESNFHGLQDGKDCVGTVALSHGEFLHVSRKFPMAKELYEKAIEGTSGNKDIIDTTNLSACNMSSEEILLAATCALGQLEAHMGNFNAAEEILTRALTKTEEHFGSNHPKVGVILTCIALMFRRKATLEHSSSLLIQEGLYRKAIEMLKAPPLDIEGREEKVCRSDIVALARGGYAETLCIQQNRKAEGEKMKSWAEKMWSNRRLSLAEALEISDDSSLKVPLIDSRISRVL